MHFGDGQAQIRVISRRELAVTMEEAGGLRVANWN
jgi:hypothetical protein